MSRLSDNLTANTDATRVPQGTEYSLPQRKILLAMARDSILSEFAGKPLAEVKSFLTESSSSKSWLLEPRGVFTTIYLNGELRGCVGYPVATHPLWRSVAETARAAAFDDSRFRAVTLEEAADLKISLSVLSPLIPIEAEQVEVGRHGLMISDGMRRGLLLPQVPVEHEWDRETFLQQTCRKAGLPRDAWQKSVTIEAFTAEVFGDED